MTSAVLEPPKPQYAQIAALIRDRIHTGAYPAGAPLPSEDRLAAELGVSRPTINRAVALLRISGDVKVRRGVGTVVRSTPRMTRAPHPLPDQPATDQPEITPPGWVTELLGPDLRVQQQMPRIDGEPAEVATAYRPAAAGRPVRYVDDIEIRLPDETEQHALGLEPTQAVVEIRRVGHTHDHAPVVVEVRLMPAHLWTLRYEWHASR